MRENVTRVPANQNEINLYCHLGEALIKSQMAEQALSHSITLKMNPAETMERADEILKQNQSYTLGKAIKIAQDKKLYDLALQNNLNAFLELRNWLIHKVICGNEEDFNAGRIKEELFDKIKSISDKAESVQLEIEYDLINFCSSKEKDMSETLALLKLQEKGVRIRSNLSKLRITASIRHSLYLSCLYPILTKIFYLADRTQFACPATSHACKPLPAIEENISTEFQHDRNYLFRNSGI